MASGYGFWQKKIKTMQVGDILILEPKGLRKADCFYMAAKSLGFGMVKHKITEDKYSVVLKERNK